MYPATNQLLPIAKVLKSYGTSGEVMVSFFPDLSVKIKTKEPVFLFYEGLSVPFYIESIVAKGTNRAILKLEDIDCLAASEEIVGKEIFVVSAKSQKEEGTSFDELVGYTLIRQDGVTLGIIEEVFDFSGNICLSLPGDRLIPFHEDLIISLDDTSRTLTLNVPYSM